MGTAKTTRMRILHVLYRLATGGTEGVVLRLAEGLDPERFEQVICTVAGESSPGSLGHTRVVTLGREPGQAGVLIGAFFRLFDRERPHLVHSRNWGTIEAVLAARLAGVPAVIHSEHGRDLGTMGRQPWRRRVLRRLCYHWADRVFAVSKELKSYYVAQIGRAAERLDILPNGVDTREFCPDAQARKQLRGELGWDEETLVVGTVGRLDPVKDHRTLFRAAELALAQGVDLRMVIVGDGVERPWLEQHLQARAGLRDRVLFTGEVRDVARWLNSFDVFALPSLSEGMSNTLLEAMAVGVPPLATRVGGNPEVIEEHDSGMLFEPGDAEALGRLLVRAAAEPEWCRELGRRARARVERHFGLPSMLARYAKLYHEVAEGAWAMQPALLKA